MGTLLRAVGLEVVGIPWWRPQLWKFVADTLVGFGLLYLVLVCVHTDRCSCLCQLKPLQRETEENSNPSTLQQIVYFHFPDRCSRQDLIFSGERLTFLSLVARGRSVWSSHLACTCVLWAHDCQIFLHLVQSALQIKISLVSVLSSQTKQTLHKILNFVWIGRETRGHPRGGGGTSLGSTSGVQTEFGQGELTPLGETDFMLKSKTC